jgi:hypothetical protein
MRSTRPASQQTTCDDDFCPAYTITVFLQPATPEKRDAKHRRELAADGWADVEGRDYCPDHTPHQQ